MTRLFTIIGALLILSGCSNNTIDVSDMKVWTQIEFGNNTANIWVDDSTGGNGTFYVGVDCNDRMSNILLIGADIAPQTMNHEDDTLIINYSHKDLSGENIHNIGVSKYIQLHENCTLTEK